MLWLALFGLALVLWLGSPTYRVELQSTGLVFYAEVQRPGLSLQTSLSWDFQSLSPKVSFAFTPQVPTATISFETESLAGILVSEGQVLKEGDLIGYVSPRAMARAKELSARLPLIDDDIVRAEAMSEIERLRRENEVRALIPGRVREIRVEQAGRSLHVQVVVARE